MIKEWAKNTSRAEKVKKKSNVIIKKGRAQVLQKMQVHVSASERNGNNEVIEGGNEALTQRGSLGKMDLEQNK